MKLTHKQKVRLARRMRSNQEIKEGSALFLTKGWEQRKKGKALKVKLKERQRLLKLKRSIKSKKKALKK